MNKLILLAILCHSFVSLANTTRVEIQMSHHHNHNNSHNPKVCLVEKWSLLSRKVKIDQECKEEKALKLVDGLFYYEKISSNPILVRYFEGELAKKYKIKSKYRYEIIDFCTGRKTFENTKNITEVFALAHKIKNPNLDPKIEKSYDLAPMTDAEAKLAFESLKEQCEKSQPEIPSDDF